jgi:serine/threonine-protein kinase HipA
MAKAGTHIKQIFVFADWIELGGVKFMGILQAEQVRGKEVFSFSYDKEWLQSAPALLLDPDLGLFTGPQYNRDEKPNFGLFTDSAPDRWGRVLMERREALAARQEGRRARALMESDYLMGVYDRYRMGAIRFKLDKGGPFLDDNSTMAAPPMTSLRTLEEASLQLENENTLKDSVIAKWLNLLISPGSSLGGARPKASVIDPQGQLWIAKFPSKKDERDIGGWEAVVNILAIKAGLNVAEGKARRFTQDHHSYLTRRFDRVKGKRIHFASAMTLLGHSDGADAAANVSYLHLAELIVRHGARPDADLEELWRRIVFNICVSNSDDHLRNHGFLLTPKGWVLSPAYDINPIPNSHGLSLNISEHSNALELDLAREVAEQFRLREEKRETIIELVTNKVSRWHEIAGKMGISRGEMQGVETAFL